MMVYMLNFKNLATVLNSLDAKKPEFWATFSVKSKMAAKKRDLEIFCFRFFIFISMMVNMLNFMNLVTFSSSLDAKNLNSGLFLA